MTISVTILRYGFSLAVGGFGMYRREWKFQFATSKVLAAVRAKIDFHDEHMAFWRDKREEVMAEIRKDGIQVNEKIALSLANPKARDWERGGDVMIRNDLQISLTETFQKLGYHTRLRDTYDGWRQALEATTDQTLALDIDDWLFFFGRDTGSDE
jgi:hypothetical protein